MARSRTTRKIPRYDTSKGRLVNIMQPDPGAQPDALPGASIIILAANEADAARITSMGKTRTTYHVVLAPGDVPVSVPAGTALLRSTLWPYREPVVSALRILHARCRLIDLTGLLGVESSTMQTPEVIASRVITDSAPVIANVSGSHQQPYQKRRKQITRAHNDRPSRRR